MRVPIRPRQVFAFSGVLNRPRGEKSDPAFLEYAVSLAAGDGKKQVCFIPTATGDSPAAIEAVTEVFVGREDVAFSVLTLFTQPSVPDAGAHLMAQDVLLVGGGSVVNLMAVWRAHGLATVMRDCWEAGVVLAGWSAGSLCWPAVISRPGMPPRTASACTTSAPNCMKPSPWWTAPGPGGWSRPQTAATATNRSLRAGSDRPAMTRPPEGRSADSRNILLVYDFGCMLRIGTGNQPPSAASTPGRREPAPVPALKEDRHDRTRGTSRRP
jgi:hypothetical protein